MPTVTLESILGWVARPVDLVKVDAQGMDLEVIRSAFSRVRQVRRFSLEVISDECYPLYRSQPTCSTVVRVARQLGFAPATRTLACAARFPRKRENSMCEMDVLFVADDVAPGVGVEAVPNFAMFDRLYLNGCMNLHTTEENHRLKRSPPAGEAVMVVLPGPTFTFYSQSWKGPRPYSYGLPYSCDRKHFRDYNGSALQRHNGIGSALQRKRASTTTTTPQG